MPSRIEDYLEICARFRMRRHPFDNELAAFLDACKSFNRNEWSNIRANVKQFIAFCSSEFVVKYSDVTPEFVRRYVDGMLRMWMSPSTVQQKLRHLRNWFRFLVREGTLQESPFEYTRNQIEAMFIPVAPVLGTAWAKEVYALLDKDTPEAAYLILFQMGFTADEMLGLRVSDLEFKGLTLTCMGQTFTVAPRHKTLVLAAFKALCGVKLTNKHRPHTLRRLIFSTATGAARQDRYMQNLVRRAWLMHRHATAEADELWVEIFFPLDRKRGDKYSTSGVKDLKQPTASTKRKKQLVSTYV